jgi:UvrB/uvrC motif
MSLDIDAVLQDWEFKPGVVQARLVNALDGRQVLQMRLELGLMQLEVSDRPDGNRPHGFPTYFDYLKNEAIDAADFTLNNEQAQEADREFLQFYHRRLCWLALRQYARALADADHTLAFMDFVRDHSPSDEYTQAHEQYRGFVLFHRTQAAAAAAVEAEDAEAAVDAIRQGLDRMRDFFVQFEAEEQMEEDGMVQLLRQMERSLRQTHGIETTLQEQLDKAVADEDYETAARIRDVLRKRPNA